MAYEVPVQNVNLAQQALLPGDLAAQGFQLGQAQLKAQRETESYNQQQSAQKALKDIFARTDTSTPEGQADLIRQVVRVSPQMGMELQAQFQKGALTQAQIGEAKAKTEEAITKTKDIGFQQATDFQKSLTIAVGQIFGAAISKTNNLPTNGPSYKASMDEANAEIDKWSKTMRQAYGDNPRIAAILDQIDKHDFHTVDEMKQFQQQLGAAQQQQSKIPSGYQQGPSGLVPIPGGPADPATIKRDAEARREPLAERVAVAGATSQARAKASAGIFSPEEQDLLASLAEKGVNLPVGMRSQGQIKATLDGLMAKNPGKTPDEIADGIRSGKIELTALSQEARTAGTQVGRVQLATNEIEQFAPLALEASAKVPRGNFVPINKLLKTYREGGVQDPNQKEFAVYVNSLLNAYDLLAARGGTDVAKREAAHKLLTTADSPEAFARGIKAFQREAQAARSAGEKAIAESAGREQKKEGGVRKYNPETGGFD